MNSKWQKYERGMEAPTWATKVEVKILNKRDNPAEEERGFLVGLNARLAYKKSLGETLYVRFHD